MFDALVESLLKSLSAFLAVILTAITTAIAAGLVAWFRSRRTRKRIESEQIGFSRSLQAQTPYGLSVRRIHSSWTIVDDQGTLIRRTSIEELSVGEGITFTRVPSSFTQSPGDVSIRSGIELTHISTFPKHVFAKCVNSDVSNYQYYVEITGGLTSHDPPLSYTEEMSYSAAILMSNEAVAQAYSKDAFRHEYLAWETNIPTEELVLVVSFPAKIPVKCYPGVFWGRTEWWFHNQELTRIENTFLAEQNGARLVVSRPIIGFRYFIYWVFAE